MIFKNNKLQPTAMVTLSDRVLFFVKNAPASGSWVVGGAVATAGEGVDRSMPYHRSLVDVVMVELGVGVVVGVVTVVVVCLVVVSSVGGGDGGKGGGGNSLLMSSGSVPSSSKVDTLA